MPVQVRVVIFLSRTNVHISGTTVHGFRLILVYMVTQFLCCRMVWVLYGLPGIKENVLGLAIPCFLENAVHVYTDGVYSRQMVSSYCFLRVCYSSRKYYNMHVGTLTISAVQYTVKHITHDRFHFLKKLQLALDIGDMAEHKAPFCITKVLPFLVF